VSWIETAPARPPFAVSWLILFSKRIASAAQHFGRDDDIPTLSITRTAQRYGDGFPMKRSALFALFTILACGGLRAQTFSLIKGREPVVSLDGLWRFHTGDNPAWASPTFNDSDWLLLRSGKSWTQQGCPAFNGYAWYRFKVEEPGDGRPLALLLTRIVSGYQVYADGKLIGSAGSPTPTRDPFFVADPAVFRLPQVSTGPRTLQIALRVWTYRPIASWFGAGSLRGGNELGESDLLSTRVRRMRSDYAMQFVNVYGSAVFAALVGLAIFALFLLRPADKEYLWFSVMLLAKAATTALYLMLNWDSIRFSIWRPLRLTSEGCCDIAALVFFSIILHARRSMLWWMACIAVAVSPLTAALIYFQWTGMGTSYALAAACNVPAYLWIIASLLICALRKDLSARLLLAPVTLYFGFGLIDHIARIAWQIRGSENPPSVQILLFSQPYPLDLRVAFDYIFLLALLIFLMLRFSLARKEEERLAAEFEAARSVQSLLIHAVPPGTSDFSVEHVYLPAQQVGGDFFQVLPGDAGSLLIVVGDVSGKGLKAAMTVSAIIGALRGCTLRAPAEVLTYLNHVLNGQISGLVTCSAVLIAADGALTLANAGHLSPYRNGEELAVAGGLPLGISPDANYEEVHHELAPGDRLTFLSDGVVEAQSPTGELFGFERAAAISNESAQTIARAAQRFGQEDDITVLSLTFAPSQVLAT
jgi:sigma-B regulation protein RsbU (phosphoserine phosphatase)